MNLDAAAKVCDVMARFYGNKDVRNTRTQLCHSLLQRGRNLLALISAVREPSSRSSIPTKLSLPMIAAGTARGNFSNISRPATRASAPSGSRSTAANRRRCGRACRWRAAASSSPSTPIYRTTRATCRNCWPRSKNSTCLRLARRRPARERRFCQSHVIADCQRRPQPVVRGKHQHAGCCYRAFKRECIANLKFFKGMHRFMPTLFKIEGFTVTEIPIG